jgi:hypothetical protein
MAATRSDGVGFASVSLQVGNGAAADIGTSNINVQFVTGSTGGSLTVYYIGIQPLDMTSITTV